MALIFDLNTGRICEDDPVFSSPESPRTIETQPLEQADLELALIENTLPSTALAEPIPAERANTNAAQFLRRMERKDR